MRTAVKKQFTHDTFIEWETLEMDLDAWSMFVPSAGVCDVR